MIPHCLTGYGGLSHFISFSLHTIMIVGRPSDLHKMGYVFPLRSQERANGVLSANFLAQQRKEGNNKLCDVELAMDGRKEYVHSAVLAVHSQMMYRIINKTTQRPPFSWDLRHFKSQSVKAVLDWMYFGEAYFEIFELESHLELAAWLEMPELHSLLERQLVHYAQNGSMLMALNAVSNPQCKMSVESGYDVVLGVESTTDRDIEMSERGAKWLVVRDERTVQMKIATTNVVLKWLNKTHSNPSILNHLQRTGLPIEHEKALINRLIAEVSHGLVQLALDSYGRIVINATPMMRNDEEKGALVTQDGVSPANSVVDSTQPMALSPLRSKKNEIDRLPDVFSSDTKSSSYGPVTFKSSDYCYTHPRPLPLSTTTIDCTHIDMVIQLSTDSVPAFRSYTRPPPTPTYEPRAEQENDPVHLTPVVSKRSHHPFYCDTPLGGSAFYRPVVQQSPMTSHPMLPGLHSPILQVRIPSSRMNNSQYVDQQMMVASDYAGNY